MAGIISAKMKRKDLEEVNDEFSEFSLSAPARKIRRLDAELPPIMEDEEPAVPLVFDQPIPNEEMGNRVPSLESVMMTDASDIPFKEERALVLYKPVNNGLLSSPTSGNVSYIVSADVLSGIKNQVFWMGNPNPGNGEEAPMGDNDKPAAAAANNCLAVVPWQGPAAANMNAGAVSVGGLAEEMMDAEEAEDASMEIEGESRGEVAAAGGLQQWPQHCMFPELPPNTSTPVMWSWR